MPDAFFVLVAALTFSISHHCPDANWHVSSVVRNKCYLIVTEEKIWFEAESYCKNAASDGHLVSISSHFEQSNIDGNMEPEPLF
jgi:hypothetical protein